MFGLKFTKPDVSRISSKSRDFLGKAYNTTKNVLGEVHKGVNTFRTVYDAVAPVFLNNSNQQVAKGARILDGHYGKGMSQYDNIRNKVVSTHDDLANRISNITI